MADYFDSLASRTPARLQIGRTGSRYKTSSYLDFRAAHAAANDAVMTEVPQETLEKLGLFEVRTKCKNKYDMITRPDWGRCFEESQKEILRQNASIGADVQIYCGDGLSAPAIGANCGDMLPLLKMALESSGISVGKPFFVRYCRVNTAREIGPLLKAKVVCVLIGERPGLITDESMSAYLAYKPHPDMSESDYTVVSNISKIGMPPVEAAACISEVIKKMLAQKAGGLALKL
ncbi:MAG: ethanolamine ammonia-lyase subunit EutC [Anaerotruncus sp.]|nr:ethanolamine ammonia-lyase subunit EutC [Anaerotruncus sp.]